MSGKWRDAAGDLGGVRGVLACWLLGSAVAIGLYFVIGLWSFPAGGLTAVVSGFILAARSHRFEPGEFYCVIWGKGVRVHHLHWPRAEIVNCTRSRGFTHRHGNG